MGRTEKPIIAHRLPSPLFLWDGRMAAPMLQDMRNGRGGGSRDDRERRRNIHRHGKKVIKTLLLLLLPFR